MNDPDYVDVLKALALGHTAEADALMGQHGAASTAEDVYRRNLLSAVFVIVLEQRLQGDHSRAVNSKKQFMESQDFQTAVTEVVAENQEAHNTMADYFFTDGPEINGIVHALADAFYETATDETAGNG